MRHLAEASRRLVLVALALVAALPSVGLLAAAPAEEKVQDFATYKRQALAPLEADYDRLAAANKDNPVFRQLQDRLALIDEVAGLLVDRFQSTRQASLDKLLADVTATVGGVANLPNVMSAQEILMECRDQFAEGLPLPPVSADDLTLLRKYYDALARAAGNYIADRGKVIMAINKKDFQDVLTLCAVMPFLHVGDADWSPAETDALPDWMRTSDGLAKLESFALSVQRPQSAYQISLSRQRFSRTPVEQLDYPAYLSKAGSAMIKARDYQGGIHCLRAGIDLARKGQRDALVIDQTLQLAEVYSTAGHPQLAANETKGLLDSYPKTPEWGKAAMLRLKYLYEAAQFKAIVEEAPKYQQDERARPYLPQIIYIAWVTYRRENQTDAAEKLQKAFLEAYPGHPLGADMYFASAMSALAGSDYDEATRLLEVIEYRYPSSRLMTKVKEIRQRLGQMQQPGGK